MLNEAAALEHSDLGGLGTNADQHRVPTDRTAFSFPTATSLPVLFGQVHGGGGECLHRRHGLA
jgi:hypothetical protein